MTDPDHTPSSEEQAASPLADDALRRGSAVWWAVGLAVLAVVALVAILGQGGDDDPVLAPETLNDFEFQTTDGDTVTLATYEGRPLVVNYFAAWCGPCRAELPDFESVHQEMGDEVVFVGISRDNVTDAWLTLIADTGVTFTTVFEGNIQGSFAFLGAIGMPTTVFIDADGNVKQVWSGRLDDTTLTELINEHLT